MVQCTALKPDGTPCHAWAVNGSEYCWFHSKEVTGSRNDDRALRIDMAKGAISTQKGFSYERIFGKKIANMPRLDRLAELARFYDDGGLISRGIDSYIHVTTASGYQLIDSETGERENENTKIVEDLDSRIDFHQTFVTAARSLLNFGFCWGEMVIEGNKIMRLNFFPVSQISVERDKKKGYITKITQIGVQNAQNTSPIEWSGESLKDVFFFIMPPENSETFPKGLLEKIYTEARQWRDMGEDLQAVTRFVSYPFRVVKVGSDVYPASEEAVIKVGDLVESLEPGDWLATRHNLEFEFHAPEVPEALVQNYIERTRTMIVSLGVPSLYTALSDVDAQTLKEIRTIFNSTVISLQQTIKRQFEEQVVKRQFELLNKHPKRKDGTLVEVVFNPLTVSVLSILELTQLVTVGAVGISEARRILESMGYGLLRGEKFREEQKQMMEEKIKTQLALAPPKLASPKESHPTTANPDKAPNAGRQPATIDSPAKTKAPATGPAIKRPQPNSPKLSYGEWLQGIEVLKDIDKFEAWELLKEKLSDGFGDNNNDDDDNEDIKSDGFIKE
jgi:hypothetical protein